MTYYTNPLPAGTKPASNYNNLNVNANSANNTFGVDHVPFTAPNDKGKHNKVTFPNAIDPATLVVDPGNIAIFQNLTNGLSIKTLTDVVGLYNIQSTVITGSFTSVSSGSAVGSWQLNRMVTPFGLILYYGIVTFPSNSTSSPYYLKLNYTDPSENSLFATINRIGAPNGQSDPDVNVNSFGPSKQQYVRFKGTYVATCPILAITRL